MPMLVTAELYYFYIVNHTLLLSDSLFPSSLKLECHNLIYLNNAWLKYFKFFFFFFGLILFCSQLGNVKG